MRSKKNNTKYTPDLVRRKLGLSQAVMARAMGISRSLLAMYEAGTRDFGPKVKKRYEQLLQLAMSVKSAEKAQNSSLVMPENELDKLSAEKAVLLATRDKLKMELARKEKEYLDFYTDCAALERAIEAIPHDMDPLVKLSLQLQQHQNEVRKLRDRNITKLFRLKKSYLKCEAEIVCLENLGVK